ncbi:MAG: alpha/beta hydrolase [Bacteroidales bacterium]|nr:alpha/beta hydrolase [Bacteroidales bacterium]
MKKKLILIVLALLGISSFAQDYRTITEIPYISSGEKDPYRKERCKLDICYPTGVKDFKTVVWYHGGGLTGGEKRFREELMNQGFAVVAVNYRLYGKGARNPDYTVDAAESLAWVFRHISEYGGNPGKIYVAGHSAGAYLTLMLALDKSWLGAHGIDADSVRWYFPIGGQTTTHCTIREEMGLPMFEEIPIIDRYAPLNNARKLGTRMTLITADPKMELLARYEENLYLKAILEGVGNDEIPLYRMEGYDHVEAAHPACMLISRLVNADE